MKKKLIFDNPACADVSVAVMFPGKHKECSIEAKEICSNCIHKNECLAGAMNSEETHGVWGGFNFENYADRRHAKRYLASLEMETA
jgi:hypothetical protein